MSEERKWMCGILQFKNIQMKVGTDGEYLRMRSPGMKAISFRLVECNPNNSQPIQNVEIDVGMQGSFDEEEVKHLRDENNSLRAEKEQLQSKLDKLQEVIGD